MWFQSRRDPRLQDEIRSHRDRLIEDYVAAGASRKDAERRAFLEFGNVAPIEEACRDVRGRWFDDVAKDARYALRTLRRYPAFSAVAVLSLALGIGANTAIFSVVNAVMLRRLPVAQADRLVHLSRIRAEGLPGTVSYPLFEYFRDNVRSIAATFAHSTSSQSIVIDGEDELVNIDLVSGTYYEVLGIAPAAGRLLSPADDAPAAPHRAAVISDRYWQRRFGRGQAALGKSFTVRDRVFTIVGVAPSSFQSALAGSVPDIVVPMQLLLPEQQRQSPDFNSLSMLARLRPGASIDQVNAEVQALYPAFVEMQSARAPERERAMLLRQRAAAWSAPDGFNPIRDNLGQPLLMLMGIVGLILLLACANVSALLVARAAARQREISIRLAIGAGRGRLVRQFLIESLLLSTIGSAVALLVSGALSPRLLGLMLNGRAVELPVGADWRVLLFTAGVTSVVCVIAGLVPAFQAVRGTVNPALKEVPIAGHRRLGKALVIAQFAIAMVLVVGATLFVGTLVKLYAVNRGFDSDGLLVISLRGLRQYSAQEALAVQARLLERLGTLPGVVSVSAARILPVSGGLWDRGVRLDADATGSEKQVAFNAIAPAYFRTLSTPIVAGREFDTRDAAAAVDVAIVNESFARRFFAGGEALGRHVTSVNVTYEIVGVVADAKYEGLRARTMETMYVPWTPRAGEQPAAYSYVMRLAGGDPLSAGAALEAVVREVDPALRFRSATPYATLIDRSIGTERMMATLGGAFGVLALVVAAAGMFGVLAFQVARRSNELGVRTALGATRWAMMRLVLSDVIWMLVPGAAIGAAIAATLTGLARSILFDLAPHEPGVFAIAATVLACSALAAAWLPVRRASRVDPLIALRHE
jgi:putative ABC transport system permease protein